MNRSHNTTQTADVNRIRRVYADRSARGLGRRYRAHRLDVILAAHQVERMLLTKLGARGWTDFSGLEVLDVGCGSGGPLVRLISHGVNPTRAHGVDLRESAIGVARSRLPSADLRVGNAAELSYADDTMDLVLQFTMFSSFLDTRCARR
jgi:ubiquinone/menaquinone biosynthesis C-methylase UbiE